MGRVTEMLDHPRGGELQFVLDDLERLAVLGFERLVVDVDAAVRVRHFGFHQSYPAFNLAGLFLGTGPLHPSTPISCDLMAAAPRKSQEPGNRTPPCHC